MSRLSIRQRLILFVFVGCMIPFIIGVIIINDSLTDYYYKTSEANTQELLYQVKTHVEHSIFDVMEERVNMLASDERVLAVNDGIRIYKDYDVVHEPEGLRDEEVHIAKYFESVKNSSSDINFIFLGTVLGGYVEYPEFKPTGPYDPRERPWYKNTIHSDGIMITNPYRTQVTNDYVISITKTVKNDDKVLGVIGTTVLLDSITSMVEDVTIGNSGYVIIVNQNDLIIVSPKNKEWLDKSPSEVGIGTIDYMKNGSQDIEINGEVSIVSVNASGGTGWKILSIMDKSELTNQTKKITRIMAISLTSALLIILIVLLYVGSMITKPILDLSTYIQSLSKFELNPSYRQSIESYSTRHDAIGTIASAMLLNFDNFGELSDQMTELDQDIQNIDLDHNEHHQLEVSNTNPFIKLVLSINKLLTMTFVYLEELRQSNEMIVKKNELLTASEEELRAQLDENESQREYIQYLAYHDALTNLPNRRRFYDQLSRALKADKQGLIALIDLDNFKSLNDTLGHIFGDRVLEAVAERLGHLQEHGIFVSRFGGDEFMILYERQEDQTKDREIVECIRKQFKSSFVVEDRHVEVNPSIGVAFFPTDSHDVNELIMYADLAMYKAKEEGRNGFQYFNSELANHLRKKADIEKLLKNAIENDGFKMVYQPIVDTYNGRVRFYEALLRLKGHFLSPAVFIPIAEESDMINVIGRIVTQKVIEQQRKWLDLGMPVVPISINFSPSQIHDQEYVSFLDEMLTTYDVSPNLIEIEITEAIFIDNKKRALDYMSKFKAMGISLSIDDFGTGYSSLNYLTFLPVSKLKLDRSLNIRFLELENIQVMDSIISLAHSLNLEVVAEGIEAEEHVKRLGVGRCDYIQGYYYSKPLEADQIPENIDHQYPTLN